MVRVVIAPLGGLPSRVTQDRKSLSLFVCPDVRILPDFYRMVSAPASNADTTRSFERGSEKRSGASGELGRMEANRGTRFFSSFFHKMFTRYMPGLKPSRASQMCLPRSPHAPKRGDLPRGSSLVRTLWKKRCKLLIIMKHSLVITRWCISP